MITLLNAKRIERKASTMIDGASNPYIKAAVKAIANATAAYVYYIEEFCALVSDEQLLVQPDVQLKLDHIIEQLEKSYLLIKRFNSTIDNEVFSDFEDMLTRVKNVRTKVGQVYDLTDRVDVAEDWTD